MKKTTTKNKSSKILANNKLLDSFLLGKTNSNSQSRKIIPSIKIPKSSGYDPKTLCKVDKFRYPNKPQIRQYQMEICMSCVGHNTLVCLPTGLGKTHIATVMILNYARWFPEGKIIFLAPTKPLVSQQSKCLRNFGGQINLSCVTSITGDTNSDARQGVYKQKRIFFCTAQAFHRDLQKNRIQAQKIVLVIFDEAHRASGNAFYCQVVKFLDGLRLGYRVMALSATPGKGTQQIQAVITNLQISKMIVKDHTDDDVSKYLFSKDIRQIVIKQSEIIHKITNLLNNLIVKPLNYLVSLKLVQMYVVKFSSYFMIFQRFQKNKDQVQITKQELGTAYASLRILKFLFDCILALRQQGFQTFKTKFFQPFMTHQNSQLIKQQSNITNKQSNKSKKATKQIPKVHKISNGLLKIYNSNQFTQIKSLIGLGQNKVRPQNHPKLQTLRKLLEQFFQCGNGNPNQKKYNSKVIIFCQLRSTALQIKDYIQASESKLIKSQLFHGQSKRVVKRYDGNQNQELSYDAEQTSSISSNNQFSMMSKVSKKDDSSKNSINAQQSMTVLHMNQKKQLKIVDDFTSGKINTLISTSVGQQGLDIGEVDCIFCYDGGMSPIRMIQRIGRTGRKREGLVYLLLMQGNQHNKYKKAIRNQQKMKHILKNKTRQFKYYAYNPSMFPQQDKIQIQFYDNQLKEIEDAYSEDFSNEDEQQQQNSQKQKSNRSKSACQKFKSNQNSLNGTKNKKQKQKQKTMRNRKQRKTKKANLLHQQEDQFKQKNKQKLILDQQTSSNVKKTKTLNVRRETFQEDYSFQVNQQYLKNCNTENQIQFICSGSQATDVQFYQQFSSQQKLMGLKLIRQQSQQHNSTPAKHLQTLHSENGSKCHEKFDDFGQNSITKSYSSVNSDQMIDKLTQLLETQPIQ